MPVLHPYKALLPTPQTAAAVAAPPYDVVSRADAAALTADNPLSFLHVTRAEVDLPASTPVYSDAVYARARENLRRLRDAAPLRPDVQPSLYVYTMIAGGRRQLGLAGAALVDDYDNGLIRRHERTRRDKEEDRTRHIRELRAHTGLVLLTCKPSAELTRILTAAAAGAPLLEATAAAVCHVIHRLSPDQARAATAALARLPALYIADGHHRAKSASRVCALCRAASGAQADTATFDRFPAVVFPADHMRILAYNRLVRDLGGLAPARLLSRLRESCEVTAVDAAAPAAPGVFHMYLPGQWYAIRPLAVAPDAIDTGILQERILAPLLGIGDPRTDDRLRFVGGVAAADRLTAAVDSGQAAVAFSLYPTTVEQLIRVADAGGVMPPKSTWFEPKLCDGLLTHCF